MFAGLFFAPSGCRDSGTFIFTTRRLWLDCEDVSGCMVSNAESPPQQNFVFSSLEDSIMMIK